MNNIAEDQGMNGLGSVQDWLDKPLERLKVYQRCVSSRSPHKGFASKQSFQHESVPALDNLDKLVRRDHDGRENNLYSVFGYGAHTLNCAGM